LATAALLVSLKKRHAHGKRASSGREVAQPLTFPTNRLQKDNKNGSRVRLPDGGYHSEMYFDSAPYDDEISLGGFFPAIQQPHNSMAVDNFFNASPYDLEFVHPEIKPVPSAGNPLPMLYTHDVDVLFDQDNKKYPHQSYDRVIPDDIVSPMGSIIWVNSNNSGVPRDVALAEDCGSQDTEKIKEDGNEGTITDPRSNDLGALRNSSRDCF
jgi:hypothetical protein